jgi:hypothetical protein
MRILESGLPDQVANEEKLARFLTSSSQFNSKMVKPSAFLPEPGTWETSVFRSGSEPQEALWGVGHRYAAQGRNLHGVAIVEASSVRAIRLDVIAAEPPPKHSAIRNWPQVRDDPERQKAQHKELAILLASKAELVKK